MPITASRVTPGRSRGFGGGSNATGLNGCGVAHGKHGGIGSGCSGYCKRFLCHYRASYTQFYLTQQNRDLTNGMQEFCTSGSVGALGPPCQ